MELTVYKESVVVKKAKEVGLRSRREQLFVTEIIIELGYSHAPSRLSVKKLRRLLLTIPSHSQLIHYHDTAVYAPIASCYKELNPFLGARLSTIIVSCSKSNLT